MKKNNMIVRKNAIPVKKHWVRLTRVCNNQCLFCLDKEAQNGTVLSLKTITNDLKKGIEYGATRAVLSGGDPTLHPHFMDIIKMAKKIGYTRVQVISNGRMFAYDNFLNTAVSSGLDEITFSIHGHTEKLHDFLTNTPGSFNESLKGLKNALKIKKLIVNIDVVINKRNVKYLKDILDYFMLLGVNEFDLLQVIPFGNAWENKQKLFYDIPKMLPYLKQVFRLSLNKCYHIWLNRFPPEYLETYEHLIQDPEKLYDEVGGRSKTFNAFIRNDEKIGCFGERCGYCYLKMFCQDLIALKKEGKLTQKIQYFCLPTEQYRHKKLVEFSVISKKRFNVMEYLNFFIHYRYNVKGLSCRRCFRDKTCDGVNINVIKKHGFKKLTLNF